VEINLSNFICKVTSHLRGSLSGRTPIGFSGSGVWPTPRPGFGILKEKEDDSFGIVILTGTRD